MALQLSLQLIWALVPTSAMLNTASIVLLYLLNLPKLHLTDKAVSKLCFRKGSVSVRNKEFPTDESVKTIKGFARFQDQRCQGRHFVVS